MSRFGRFIRQHLVADDPAPGYSRLDRLDGHGETPLSYTAPTDEEESAPANDQGAPLSASAHTHPQDAALASIAERLAADEEEFANGVADQSARDRRYLLALLAERQAQISRVEELATYLDGLAPSGEHFAGLIRAALSPRHRP